MTSKLNIKPLVITACVLFKFGIDLGLDSKV